MIRLFFLVPLLTFGLYFLFLKANGWSIEQGKKGFKTILILNVAFASALFLVMFLTNLD